MFPLFDDLFDGVGVDGDPAGALCSRCNKKGQKSDLLWSGIEPKGWERIGDRYTSPIQASSSRHQSISWWFF